LFFNFLNPQASRGNPLQGAADQLSLVRFAATLNVTASESGGASIAVDPTKIVFFGHSQGSTEGSLMLPFGDTYVAALLSGNGASLMDSLATKSKPVDIRAALPVVLQDPTLSDPAWGAAYAQNHPVLSLIQQWIDPADPLNFARYIARSPLNGHVAKHAFQTYGLGDTYSPPVTLATFAIAGDFPVLAHDSSVTTPDSIGGFAEVPVPVSGNVAGITLGVREYQAPSSSDGHFVVFDVPSANADAVRFLSSSVSGGAPSIGQ
jgi:hypothetical protein